MNTETWAMFALLTLGGVLIVSMIMDLHRRMDRLDRRNHDTDRESEE